MQRPAIFWLSFALFQSLSFAVHAESFPNPTVTEMCLRAPLIVDGTWQGDKRVVITRIWRAPDSFSRDKNKELSVMGLDTINRNRWYFDGTKFKSEAIDARDVTLFLERDAKGEWSPLDLLKVGETLGSPGVVWRKDNDCYHYFQEISPGPYSLTKWQDVSRKKTGAVWVDTDLKEIRRRMEASLSMNKPLREVLQSRDATQRATELIKYLSPRTSPDPAGTYRFIAEEALQETPHLPLAPILNAIETTPPKEDLHPYLSLLWYRGDDSTTAQPLLVKILERQDHNLDSCIVTLMHLRDARSIPQLRPFLRAPSPTTRYLAAHALTILRDQDSFGAIAELIPAEIKQDEIERVKNLLDLLYFLDKAKALPIATRVAAAPVMAPVRKQIRSLQKE